MLPNDSKIPSTGEAPRFVLTGITGLRNHGVEALVYTTCKQLKLRYPSCGITVLTLDPAYDQLLISDFAEPVPNSVHKDKKGKKQMLLHAASSLMGKKQSHAVRAIKAATLVIASGGDVFSSDYGALESHLRPLRIALDHNVPIAFLGHSIGPFKSESEAASFVSVAKRASLITARESLSYEYLKNDLGLGSSKLHLASDVAFLLSPPEPAVVEAMAKHYGIDSQSPTVAMAISQGMSRYALFSRAKHLAVLKDLATHLLKTLSCKILLVPHVQDSQPANDDRNLTTDLLKELEWNPRVKAAHAHHTASEFKGLIGRCDFVLAERMHAAIAGLGSGVPTMPIGYSVKSYGIMRDIIGDSYKNHVFGLEDWLDPAAAKSIIKERWAKRDAMRAQLDRSLPEVRRKAESNFELVEKILSSE